MRYTDASNTTARKRLLIAGILSALVYGAIVLFPFLAEFQRSSGRSLRLFAHVDELVYLQLPYFIFEGRSPYSYYFEYANQKGAADNPSQPTWMLDYTIGAFATALSLEPALLGICLDIVCWLFSFLALLFLFRSASFDVLSSVVASIVTLCFPLFLWPESFAVGQTIWFDKLVSYGHFPFAEYPVLRGIYTQVSYPLVALCFGFLFKWLNDFERQRVWLFLLAIFSGLLVYTYVFAWITVSAVTLLSMCFAAMCNKKPEGDTGIKQTIIALASYLIPNVVVASYGIYLLTLTSNPFVAKLEELSEYWYFAPLSLLSAAVLFLLAKLRCKGRIRLSLLTVLIALLLSNQLLLNLQPLLGTFFAPAHFYQLYLAPFFSGLIVGWLLTYPHSPFVSFFSARNFRVLRAFTFSFLSICLFVSSYQRFIAYSEFTDRIDRDSGIVYLEVEALLDYIYTNLPRDSVIALSPMQNYPENNSILQGFYSPLPNLISLVTQRHVLLQYWSTPSSNLATRRMERELALSLYLVGHAQFIEECPSERVALPGDLYFGTISVHRLLRRNLCDSYSKESKPLSRCELIKSFRVDYILRESSDSMPEWIKKFVSVAWRKKGNSYVLYKFNRDKVLHESCKSLSADGNEERW